MKWTPKYLRAGAATLVVAGSLGTYAATSSATQSHRAAHALPGAGKPAVVLGDKSFAEENILGQLYAQALEAKGYKITLKANIGETEEAWKGLTSGQIQAYPEYDGTLLATEGNVTKNAASAAAEATETKAFAAKHGITFTNITPFTDSDAIVVTNKFAGTNKLTTLNGLKRLGKKVVLYGPPEFATRFPDGLLGIEKTYGAKPAFHGTSIGTVYNLLDKGQATAVVGFTTDPQLTGNKYKALQDPKHIFGFQNVGLLVKSSVAKAEGTAFTTTVNKVSSLLTQKAIIALNNAVEIDKQSAASVAKAFLKANHLL